MGGIDHEGRGFIRTVGPCLGYGVDVAAEMFAADVKTTGTLSMRSATLRDPVTGQAWFKHGQRWTRKQAREARRESKSRPSGRLPGRGGSGGAGGNCTWDLPRSRPTV